MNKPKNLQTTTQIIAREGIKPIAICVIFMFLCIFLRIEFLALIALICAIFCAFIFRNSERIAQNRAQNAIIAPCDGRIVDIATNDSIASILVKINIFDCGIFRIPAQVSRIESAFRFGLFIHNDKNLQEILNTRHTVSGFLGESQIFKITLLPEAWNKANIYALDSSDSAKSDSPKKDSRKIRKDSSQNAIFAGDRLGFMKYGFLRLEIHAPCAILAQRGDSLFAGESLLGTLAQKE